MSSTFGSKFILFSENCNLHSYRATLFVPQNVSVRSLLPNTTNRILPMDAKIITAIKPKECCRPLYLVFKNIAGGRKFIYSIDVY